MNQIVFTGEEKKKLLKIETIVTIFAIGIIILGGCIAINAGYSRVKINEEATANAEPKVEIAQNEIAGVVTIKVTHIRGIRTIAYSWNDEEEIILNENNKKQLEETIDLLAGTNTLTVKITEENGKTVTYEKTYTSGNIPKISLEAVTDGVKIISSSEQVIDYIEYSWDDGEKTKIEVGKTTYEGTIETPRGLHTLNIVVVDKYNNKATKKQEVVGDTAPTLEVKINKETKSYAINAEDDEQLTKAEITYENGEKQEITINDKTFNHEIKLTSGENKLMVVVYNLNGLSTYRKVMYVLD